MYPYSSDEIAYGYSLGKVLIRDDNIGSGYNNQPDATDFFGYWKDRADIRNNIELIDTDIKDAISAGTYTDNEYKILDLARGISDWDPDYPSIEKPSHDGFSYDLITRGSYYTPNIAKSTAAREECRWIYNDISSLFQGIDIVDGPLDLAESALLTCTGLPETVLGQLHLSKTMITSLDGSPKYCTAFRCTSNRITSLIGGPISITQASHNEDEWTGTYDVSDNKYLSSLEGAPRIIPGSFIVNRTNIINFKGGPEKVGKLSARALPSLESLEGAPKTESDFIVTGVSIKVSSLKGCPSHIPGVFNISHEVLSPSLPHKSLLKDLSYGPVTVDGHYNVSYCHGIETLIGAPAAVGGDFLISPTSLKSIEGCPKIIGGDFVMYLHRDTNWYPTEEEIRAVCEVKGTVRTLGEAAARRKSTREYEMNHLRGHGPTGVAAHDN